MNRIPLLEIVGNSEGGGARIVAALLAALDPERFAATLVAPDSAWLAAVCAEHGVRFHPLPLMASRTGGNLTRGLRALIGETRPAVVHAHGTRAATFAVRSLPQRTETPDGPALIYSEHLFSFDARRGPLRLPWYALERTLCRRADFVTTSCQTNARWLVRRKWCEAARIPLTAYGIASGAVRAQVAAAVPRAALGVPEDAPLVGTLARMVPQKGLPVLLDAIPRVLAAKSAARFVVVGDGPLRTALEGHAARLGLSERIHFLGSHAEPWRLLAHADVIALPSLYEGLPLVALEALAAGLPVVTTSVGGNPEVVIPGRTGLLVPPRDATALAAGIVALLRDPAARAVMSAAGPEMVRRYELQPVLDEFADLYATVAAQRGARAVTDAPPQSTIPARIGVEPRETTYG